MKKSALLIALVMCILLFAGCKGDKNPNNTSDSTAAPEKNVESTASQGVSELDVLKGDISQNGSMLGVGFFGYVDPENNEDAIKSFVLESSLVKRYPFLNSCTQVTFSGAELYALVPANDSISVSIYPSEISESGDYTDKKDSPVYKGKPGETVILRCNISEVCANVLIEVTDGKNSIEFHPTISLENGSFAKTDGCYDFSIKSQETERVDAAWGRLCGTDEVSYALNHGKQLLYTGETQTVKGQECVIFALGTDSGDRFLKEQLYAVSDDAIYAFNVEADSWETLGVG